MTNYLPYIDEHSVPTGMPTGRAWAGLMNAFARSSARGRILARLLGCEPASGTPTFTGALGETVPGFRIVDVEPGGQLGLEGRHRFSRYRLEFVVAGGQLRARTYAAFPGWTGSIYRAIVIGTGAHRVTTRNLLRRIVRNA